jgi:hypothetical protein
MNIQTVFEYSLFDFRVLQQARPLTLQIIENYSQGQMRDQKFVRIKFGHLQSLCSPGAHHVDCGAPR